MVDDGMMPIGRVKRLEMNQVIAYFVHYPDVYERILIVSSIPSVEAMWAKSPSPNVSQF